MATVSSSIGSFTPKVRYTAGDSYQSRNIVHELLSGNVAVTFGGEPRRTGTLSFMFENGTDAYTAYLIMRDGYVFELNDFYDAGTSPLYFVVSGNIMRNWDESTADTWTLSVDFQEVQQ